MEDTRLAQHLLHAGLAPSTRKLYLRIAQRMDRANPAGWFQQQVAKDRATNTLLPLRAAAKYVLIAEHGLSERDADDALPRAKGRTGLHVEGLTAKQLRVYASAVSALSEPARSVLLLLPWTGLRIEEMVSLRSNDLQAQDGRVVLAVRQGKGRKARVVPLFKTAKRILAVYRKQQSRSGPWLFPSRRGTPITSDFIRKQLRRVLGSTDLGRVTPHMLRHTYATMLSEAGVGLQEIQALLGHKDISSTQRYLHPSTERLGAAVDKLETLAESTISRGL